MKDNKNIERLFQEKFKDFEALPPQNSWDIIASRLNEKKKKKIKPAYKKKIGWEIDKQKKAKKRIEGRAQGRAERKSKRQSF